VISNHPITPLKRLYRPQRRFRCAGWGKGKRGRGAAGKVPVFGLLKRGGRVYTKIIPDASSATLMPIIERRIIPDSVVYTDCWRGYNVLDVAEFKHYRTNHSKLFANKQNHII
jgi:transposase